MVAAVGWEFILALLLVAVLFLIPILIAFGIGLVAILTTPKESVNTPEGNVGQIAGVKYASIINEACAKHPGIGSMCPALIAGMIQQESNWNPKAGSHAGAQGLLQLMPFNWKGIDPHDPRQNIFRGTEIIASHIKRYDGNLKLALAAYNAGAGAVAADLKKGGDGIPNNGETPDYVQKVFKYYENYKTYVKNGQIMDTKATNITISQGGNRYPYRDSGANRVDKWGFYTKQCTSFAAWRVNDMGVTFSNMMRHGRFSDATNWDNNANRIGFGRVNKTPAPGAVAQWDAGAYGHSHWGHVAFVTKVEGNMVTIEEYNYPRRFSFNRRVISADQVSHYIHFR